MAALGQGVEDAYRRLAQLLPTSPAALSDDQLVEFTDAVEVLARQTDALRLTAAREFDNRTDPSLAEDSFARKLGQKNAAGALGRAQAAEIIQPLLPALNVADPAAVAIACGQLVELAQALPASAVVEAARAWREVLDPDGVEPEEKTALEKRFVALGRAKDGLVKLTGLLTIEQAATIRTVLDAYLSPRSRSAAFAPADPGAADPNAADPDVADVDTAGPVTPAGGIPPADTRTRGQECADIFQLVFAAQARAADVPGVGGAHPTILVAVGAEDLESGTGAAWIDGEAEPVSAATAARIASSGGFQRVELGPGGEVLDLGRTQRCFSPAQRRALAVRDRGCVIPGCTIPARWCEIHHVAPWRRGGPTDAGNAALLCWFHHQIIDEGPWRLRMSDGVPEIRWVFGSHASPWVRAVHRPQRRRQRVDR